MVILTVADQFSKIAQFIALLKLLSTKETAKVVLSYFSAPRSSAGGFQSGFRVHLLFLERVVQVAPGDGESFLPPSGNQLPDRWSWQSGTSSLTTSQAGLYISCGPNILINTFLWHPPASPHSTLSTGNSHHYFRRWRRRRQFPRLMCWFAFASSSAQAALLYTNSQY